MGAGTPSLLSFLEAPVLVGDPDGRAAYVNPAFESRFGVTAEGVTGRPLALLFDGGLREAMLRAVADACERGMTARFHLRHAGVGYAAVASPIVAEDARVGVVMVLVESSAADERLLALGRRLHDASRELGAQLAQLAERLAARGEPEVGLADEALRAHARLQGADAELQAALAGRPGPAPAARFDPARLLAEVAARVRGELAGGAGRLELRMPERLPAVRGEPGRLAVALCELLRERVGRGAARVLLAARAMERQGRGYVVVSLLEGAAAPAPEPVRLRQAVEELGGQLRSSVDPARGRTLAFRLPV
jgi:PAS domain S-box-containing protein